MERDEGQTLSEYVIVLSVIATTIMLAIAVLSGAVAAAVEAAAAVFAG